jgi:hypothetical protein
MVVEVLSLTNLILLAVAAVVAVVEFPSKLVQFKVPVDG